MYYKPYLYKLPLKIDYIKNLYKIIQYKFAIKNGKQHDMLLYCKIRSNVFGS